MNGKLHATATHTIRWNLLGSIAYELTKAAHQLGLYIIMPTTAFADISIKFSLIYLTVFIAGLEGGESLLPHIATIKQYTHARRFIFQRLILPQLILYTGAAILFQCRMNIVFNMNLPSTALLCLITVTEGLRSHLRTILHPLYGAKTVTSIDQPLTALYFICVWGGYYLDLFTPTPTNLLIPFAVTSLIAASTFIYKIWRLRGGTNPNPQLPTASELTRGRFTLCLLHLPRNIFSGNFLVPFFAHAIGPAFASITKITSEVAFAVRALLKRTIGVSLNTLLANFNQQESQRAAFTILWQQLNETLISATVILVCLMPHMYNGSSRLSMMLGLFIGIATIDYLFIIYEYFYIMNNQAGWMALYRGIEAAVGLAIITVASNTPIVVMVCVTIIKICMLYFCMQNAHTRWQVHPHAKIRAWVVGCAIVIGALLSGGITVAKYRSTSREHNKTQQGAARPSPLFQVKRPAP